MSRIDELQKKLPTVDTDTVILLVGAFNLRLKLKEWQHEWEFEKAAIPLLLEELNRRFPFLYKQWVDAGKNLRNLSAMMPCENGRDGKFFRRVC